MARTRGTGNLQQEKNGTWTLRVGWKGRRLSRSTGTTDRARAEKALARFLAPLGGGERHLALADAWPFAPAAVPFASVPSAGISIEARLKRLQRLSRQGLVTAAEFAELRRKMLAML